jgi:hypothetical protein
VLRSERDRKQTFAGPSWSNYELSDSTPLVEDCGRRVFRSRIGRTYWATRAAERVCEDGKSHTSLTITYLKRRTGQIVPLKCMIKFEKLVPAEGFEPPTP